MKTFKNNSDALVHGLVLCVTADGDEESNKTLKLCEQITESLSEFEVARCKKRAEQILDAGGSIDEMLESV